MKKFLNKKYCILFLLVISILFCLIKIALPCKEYHYTGNAIFDEAISDKAIIYEGISLPPGVYRIELEYTTDKDLQGMCNVMDGTVFSGGLLSSGEPFYSNLDKTGYQIWLLEKTDNLQVWITYYDNGQLATGNLKIIETNLLWTMLLTVLLFIGIVVCMVLLCCRDNQGFLASVEKRQSFFLVMLIGLIASFPYMCGHTTMGSDLIYHLLRIEGIKDGLLSGQFPVRLEPEWLYGHGYADAIFYCGTFLYVPALLRLAGFPVTASYNIYCILLNFSTAWISYFCFSRIFKNRWHGIICSALYTLSIFRIYRLLIVSAVGEASALTFIPLIIYALYRIYTEDPTAPEYKTSWIPMMLGLSGLIQTHVLTCEITILVMLLFCFVKFRKLFCKNTLLELVKGGLAALLLSLWFIVPFLDYYITQPVHIKFVSARTIQDRGLYLAQLAFHFYGDGGETVPLADNGMWHSHPVGIGLVLIIGLVVFLILWYSGKVQNEKAAEISFVERVALIGLLLLCMSTKYFPWDKIQSLHSVFAALVSSLQFPYRFLGWGTVCLVFVFGYCLNYLKKVHKNGYLILLAVAFIGILTSDMYLLDYMNASQSTVKIYNEEDMGVGYISGAEYIPEGTVEEDITFREPEIGEGVQMTDYRKEYLRINLECNNQGKHDSFIDVPLLYYKGYRAVETESGKKLEICAGENNTVRVLIPASFDGTLEIRFVPPVYWRISEVISAVVCMGAIVVCGKNGRKKYVKA